MTWPPLGSNDASVIQGREIAAKGRRKCLCEVQCVQLAETDAFTWVRHRRGGPREYVPCKRQLAEIPKGLFHVVVQAHVQVRKSKMTCKGRG